MRLAAHSVNVAPRFLPLSFIFFGMIFIRFLYGGFDLFCVTKEVYRNPTAGDNP